MHKTRSITRKPNERWVAVVAGMASYIDSAALVGFSIAIVIYQSVLGLTPGQIGLAGGVIGVGAAVGALVGGSLGDRLGRRPVFIVTVSAIAIGAIFLVFAPSFAFIVAGGLLVGLGTGADLPVSLATIAEAASDKNRGKLLVFSNILWIVGIIASIGLGYLVGNMGRLGAQIIFGHVAVVAILVLCARWTIPESAPWLEARAERKRGIGTIRAKRSSLRDLLGAPYAIPFFVLMVFSSLNGLAANTGGQFGAYLLVNHAGVDISTASLIDLVLLPITLIGYWWFGRIVDGRHRFTYFTVGAILYVVSQLIPAVFGFSVTTYVVSGIIGSIGASFSFQTILTIWMQKSFPTLLRSTAQGSINAVTKMLAAVLATVTPMLAAGGPTTLYYFLAGLSFVGMAVAWLGFRKRDSHDEFDVEDRPTTDPSLQNTHIATH